MPTYGLTSESCASHNKKKGVRVGRYRAYLKDAEVDEDDPLFLYPTTHISAPFVLPGVAYPTATFAAAYYPAPAVATAYTPIVSPVLTTAVVPTVFYRTI
jgi:hypothetical protein